MRWNEIVPRLLRFWSSPLRRLGECKSSVNAKPEPVALWIGKQLVLRRGEKVSEQELQDRIDKALAALKL
jgi:hypothetical protein